VFEQVTQPYIERLNFLLTHIDTPSFGNGMERVSVLVSVSVSVFVLQLGRDSDLVSVYVVRSFVRSFFFFFFFFFLTVLYCSVFFFVTTYFY
jgi:hypothetical protein